MRSSRLKRTASLSRGTAILSFCSLSSPLPSTFLFLNHLLCPPASADFQTLQTPPNVLPEYPRDMNPSPRAEATRQSFGDDPGLTPWPVHRPLRSAPVRRLPLTPPSVSSLIPVVPGQGQRKSASPPLPSSPTSRSISCRLVRSRQSPLPHHHHRSGSFSERHFQDGPILPPSTPGRSFHHSRSSLSMADCSPALVIFSTD